MKSFAVALALLLAPSTASAKQQEIRSVTVIEFQCVAPQSVKGKGLVGDKAIIAADGGGFAVECGDGHIKSWNAKEKVIAENGSDTVFRVSKAMGFIPEDLSCPVWMKESEVREHNCTVADVADDGNHFLLDSDTRSFVMERGRAAPVYEFDAGRRNSAFLTDWNELVKAEPFERPPGLSRINVQSGERKTLLSVPFSDSIVGNLESEPNTIGRSQSTGLIIVAFDGAFIGVREMTYVAAYALDGRERWKIRNLLPRTEERINGDMAFVRVFGGGLYVAFQKRSRVQTQILDARSGNLLGELEGSIIDAARDGNALLIRQSATSVALVRWSE